MLHANRNASASPEAEWFALLRSIAGGDQLALHTLYERTHRLVFTFMMRITRHRETAEELTIDVFHDVWRRAATHDPAAGPVLGWIMNQARCRAIDRMRYEQRQKRAGHLADLSAAGAADGPREAAVAAEQVHLLRLAVQDLIPEERQAIETAFFSGLTYREVALLLQQPLGTVKTRIRSGLAKLRDALAAWEER